MYKLKNSYIDRMVEAGLSSREVDFILYIANYQDVYGTVFSVYYKDVCQAINISYQKFYDILASLQEKKLITWEKQHRTDICVTLVGNDFSDKNFKAGYLKVAATDFMCDSFRELKAGSKLLFLYLKRFTEGKHMFVQNFYEEFCRRFNVVRKTLQEYIHELKEKKLLFISKKRNKAYHYEMTMKNSTVISKKDMQIPNENAMMEQNISDAIYRRFKGEIDREDRQTRVEMAGILSMLNTNRAKEHRNFIRDLVQAVQDSLALQKRERRPETQLYASLVNKCLTANINRI